MPNQWTYGRTIRERLLARLIIEPATGCLLWAGHRDRDGYGKISAGTDGRLVHRVMWELFEGPIPDGLTLDHLCQVRHCASIAHLEPVSLLENIRRGSSARRGRLTAKASCT